MPFTRSRRMTTWALVAVVAFATLHSHQPPLAGAQVFGVSSPRFRRQQHQLQQGGFQSHQQAFLSSLAQQQQGVVNLGINLKPCPPDVSPCVCRPTPDGPEVECSSISDAAQLQLVRAFQGPNHFRRITLQRSRVADLPAETFGDATADVYVVQNNPLLESIELGAFGRFASPKEIVVQRNPILEEFPFRDVKNWLDLEKFVLTDNRILEVPDYAFDGASSSLREIHMQRNVILDLGPLAFRGLPSLQYLDLSGNQIASLGAGSLFVSEPLKHLDLSRNRIASIDVKAFEDPNRAGSANFAEYIDFSSNLFTFLERAKWEHVFKKLDAFKSALEEPVTTTTPFNPFAILQQFGNLQQFSTSTPPPTLTTTVLPVEPTGLHDNNPEALFFQFLQSLFQQRGAAALTGQQLNVDIMPLGVASSPDPALSSTADPLQLATGSSIADVIFSSSTLTPSSTMATVSTEMTPMNATAAATSDVTAGAATSTPGTPAVGLHEDRVSSIWNSILSELDALIDARKTETPGQPTAPDTTTIAKSDKAETQTITQQQEALNEIPRTGGSLSPLTDVSVSSNTVPVDIEMIEPVPTQDSILGEAGVGQREPKALPVDGKPTKDSENQLLPSEGAHKQAEPNNLHLDTTLNGNAEAVAPELVPQVEPMPEAPESAPMNIQQEQPITESEPTLDRNPEVGRDQPSNSQMPKDVQAMDTTPANIGNSPEPGNSMPDTTTREEVRDTTTREAMSIPQSTVSTQTEQSTTSSTTSAPVQPPAPIVDIPNVAVKDALDSIALLKRQLQEAIQAIPLMVAAALGNGLQQQVAFAGAQVQPQVPASNASTSQLQQVRRRRAIEPMGRRAKRQVPGAVDLILPTSTPEPPRVNATAPTPPPRPIFAINFNNNPFVCNCDMQWLFFDRFRYADQILGIRCENRMNVFQLSTVHFLGC